MAWPGERDRARNARRLPSDRIIGLKAQLGLWVAGACSRGGRKGHPEHHRMRRSPRHLTLPSSAWRKETTRGIC